MRPADSLSQCCFYLTTILLITLAVVQPSLQLSNSEEDLKRASHNIMRFGRTSGHNIMRFGRAGHNIMHFGKRDSAGPSGASPSQEAAALAAALPLAYAAGYGPSQGSGVLPVAGSSEPEGESAGLDYQQFLYTPYRRFNYNYNKKADNRDNVFMHFG